MNIRCRGPTGQCTLTGIDPAASFSSLQTQIAEKLGIPTARQEILSGFPPRSLKALTGNIDVSISGMGIASGDTLLVRECESNPPIVAPSSSIPEAQEAELLPLSEDEQLARALAASLQDVGPGPSALQAGPLEPTEQQGPGRPAQPSQPAPEGPSVAQIGAPTSVALPDGTIVARRIVESDNSCLFNAVGYVMERSRHCSQRLRSVIADAVAADPETYTEGYLGKSNAEYRSWIRDPQKWGGAIELSILSRHFGREIAAYDIQTKRVDLYGQDQGYSERAMLIYDGLHYDALAQAAFEDAPEELDVTIFDIRSSSTSAVEHAAAQLVAKAHKARQFTDTASFTLRCGICQLGVKGEKEALQHAQQTGHQNFSEYH